ncbi:MAG TPA: DUF2252 domain-containing protein [Acidimicrobiia bacterium]|nr:DUF2252 domain-containing protein [Acidimicrobiia bacterium]
MNEQHLRPEERVRTGKAARTRTPRTSHADWTPSPDRASANALLERQNTTRLPWLVPVRRERMLASPFAFYRGAAAVMAADLASTPRTGITVQVCGDAHLANFGVYASPERQLVFDINDFDETIGGPWEWDLKRLTTSVMIDAQHHAFDEATCRTITLRTAESYRLAMQRLAAMGTLEVWYSHVTSDQVQEIAEIANNKRVRRTIDRYTRTARSRDNLQAFSKLTEQIDGRFRIRSDPPLLIPLRDLDSENDPDELEAQARTNFEEFKNSLSDDRQHLLDRFELVDVAVKVVGVGSVGTRCLVVLLQEHGSGDPLFLQVKEAGRSVLEEHLHPSIYDNQGRRVVEGQRLMQAVSDIFLGWSSAEPTPDFYWRQLRDWKGPSNIEFREPDDLERFARLCGATLARAHARSGDAIAIAAYLGKNDVFDRAVTSFSASYAKQNLADFERFGAAKAVGSSTNAKSPATIAPSPPTGVST